MCVSFVQEAQVMAIVVPPVPAQVVSSPKSAVVVAGKKVQFTATVYDSGNHKIKGVKLDWSLTSTVAGCAINQNGVLTVAKSTTPETYSDLVQVAVQTNPAILAQATVSILAEPFSGGVFIGTHECTAECNNGSNPGAFVIHAAGTTFNGLAFSDDDSSFQKFSGTIGKNGNVSAAFEGGGGHEIFITGSITFTGGIATGISGTWTQPSKPQSGTWTTDAATVPGAGPKIGTWSVPKQTPPSGSVAVIFNDDYTLSGIAMHKDNGKAEGSGFSGTWTSDDISFTFSGGGSVTGGTGTYNPATKTGSGHLYNNTTKVGSWTISNM